MIEEKVTCDLCCKVIPRDEKHNKTSYFKVRFLGVAFYGGQPVYDFEICMDCLNGRLKMFKATIVKGKTEA